MADRALHHELDPGVPGERDQVVVHVDAPALTEPEAPGPSVLAVPRGPVAALRVDHHARGLRLHARTALPGWLGEPLDVGWALDGLHPLTQRRP